VTHVQGHNVKYRNHHNSTAANCSILLKLSTEFDYVTADICTTNIQDQRSNVKVTA